MYAQHDRALSAPKEPTWQSMQTLQTGIRWSRRYPLVGIQDINRYMG